jgi:hypothetical protein
MTHVDKIENAQSQTIMKNEKKKSVISKSRCQLMCSGRE